MVIIENGEKLKVNFNLMAVVRDKILCKPMKMHDVSEAGIILVGKTKMDCVPIVVIEIGPEVKYPISKGDLILIRPSAGIFFGTTEEDALILVGEPEILSFIQREKLEVIDLPTQEEAIALDKRNIIGEA